MLSSVGRHSEKASQDIFLRGASLGCYLITDNVVAAIWFSPIENVTGAGGGGGATEQDTGLAKIPLCWRERGRREAVLHWKDTSEEEK